MAKTIYGIETLLVNDYLGIPNSVDKMARDTMVRLGRETTGRILMVNHKTPEEVGQAIADLTTRVMCGEYRYIPYTGIRRI